MSLLVIEYDLNASRALDVAALEADYTEWRSAAYKDTMYGGRDRRYAEFDKQRGPVGHGPPIGGGH